jgi:hypothetical protein
MPQQLPEPNSLIFLRDAFWKVVDRVHCYGGTPRVLLFVQRHTPDIQINFGDDDEQPAIETSTETQRPGDDVPTG